MKIDWDAIRVLAEENGRPIKTMLALTRQHDPFYLGETRMLYAGWFAGLYHQHGFSRGVHIRRIHYRLISQEEPVLMPDGSNYENTEKCYNFLGGAAGSARYAELVSAGDFDDRRNPEPMLFLAEPVDAPSVDVLGSDEDEDWFSIRPPSLEISVWAGDVPDEIRRPELCVTAPCPSPYHVEIWCEKSTINDVLIPLARQYGLNLQTALGELSVTRCEQLVARAGPRPIRILYISDFDPGGQSMPVAAARKIEFFARKHEDETGIELDIQLQPIALTHDQCNEYRLPRTPLKETERRAATFEARFGEGATELDALEALRPGELRRILVEEIERFHNPDFEREWNATLDDAESTVAEVESEVFRLHADARAALEQRRADLVEAAAAQAAAVQTLVNERMADLRTLADERFAEVARQGEELADEINAHLAEVESDLEDEAPDIDGFEWPEPPDGWDDPLFDSTRTYVDQIDRYKGHQGKLTARKERVAVKRNKFVCAACGAEFMASSDYAKFCSAKCKSKVAYSTLLAKK